jgi:hypothetical protein
MTSGVTAGVSFGPIAGANVRSAEYVVGALPASPYAARSRSELIRSPTNGVPRHHDSSLATQLALYFGYTT